MSSNLQIKLLRVIQEKVIERVGGIKPLPVDIRLIVATNKTLKEEVKAGRFRDDLFFRLNVIHIVLPPLRERQEDIGLLMNHFIDKYSKERKSDAPINGVDQEVIRLFYNYRWPGNVRELENVIERAMILCPDSVIHVSDLPKDFIDNSASVNSFIEGIPEDAKLEETIDLIEKKMIERALKLTNNVQSGAAELLGIGKSSLNKKIKKYEIEE